MKTITICTYYKDGIRIGEAPIPPYSTRDIRRAIAKSLFINQYDECSLQDFYLGAATAEEKRISFKTYAIEDLKEIASATIIPSQDLVDAIRSEAEPIP